MWKSKRTDLLYVKKQPLSQVWKYWALWLCVVNLPFPVHGQATYYRLVGRCAWSWISSARNRHRAVDIPMKRTQHISPGYVEGNKAIRSFCSSFTCTAGPSSSLHKELALRIIQSEKHLDCKRPLWLLSAMINAVLLRPSLNHIPQCNIYMSLKHTQEW